MQTALNLGRSVSVMSKVLVALDSNGIGREDVVPEPWGEM